MLLTRTSGARRSGTSPSLTCAPSPAACCSSTPSPLALFSAPSPGLQGSHTLIGEPSGTQKWRLPALVVPSPGVDSHSDLLCFLPPLHVLDQFSISITSDMPSITIGSYRSVDRNRLTVTKNRQRSALLFFPLGRSMNQDKGPGKRKGTGRYTNAGSYMAPGFSSDYLQ